jgi:hypothetical protein
VDRSREVHLLAGQRALGVLREQAREDEQRVERRAQLVRHVRQELGLVGRALAQLLGLLAQLGRERLGLHEQLLRAHRRPQRVEHDAERLGDLLQERALHLAERPQGGELDHAEDLLLEHDRQDEDLAGRALAEREATLT